MEDQNNCSKVKIPRLRTENSGCAPKRGPSNEWSECGNWECDCDYCRIKTINCDGYYKKPYVQETDNYRLPRPNEASY